MLWARVCFIKGQISGNEDLLVDGSRRVKNYLFHIFDKLGISNRVELVLYAVTNPKAAPSAPSPQREAPRQGCRPRRITWGEVEHDHW